MDLRDNNSPKKWKNRTLVSSMEFAITGIVTAFKEERNMRKHMVSAILATAAGAVFRISALENVVDLASDYHFSMLAKNAKDMAAGAVLVVSTYTVITGLIIFVPKIIALIFGNR